MKNNKSEHWVCVECGKDTGPIPEIYNLDLVEILRLSRENKCRRCLSYQDLDDDD